MSVQGLGHLPHDASLVRLAAGGRADLEVDPAAGFKPDLQAVFIVPPPELLELCQEVGDVGQYRGVGFGRFDVVHYFGN
jgi:hypothetical protein